MSSIFDDMDDMFSTEHWKAQYPDVYELQPDGSYEMKPSLKWKNGEKSPKEMICSINPQGPVQPIQNKVKFCDELEKRGKYTPDFAQLRTQKHIPLFVYGDEQTEGRLNNLMYGSKYLGRAFSTSDMYVMKQPTWPLVFKATKQNELKGHIKGEVFCVSPEHMLYMDQMKSHGKLFKRELKSFFLRDQQIPIKSSNRVGNPSIQAWIYLGHDVHWASSHLPGAPRMVQTGSKRKYYEYDSIGK